MRRFEERNRPVECLGLSRDNLSMSGPERQEVVVFMVRQETRCAECGEELG